MARTILCLLSFVITVFSYETTYEHIQAVESKQSALCYNELKQPQRCIPEFGNAAFNVRMEATNTCGDNGPTPYCIQTSASSDERICHECKRGDFSPYFLTDLHHESENQTWWQSDTMYEKINWPNSVNLTLHLGKAYDITYIRIVFYSPRPESFVIYKRTNENSDWVPYQYYSQSCRETYGIPESKSADVTKETRALCTSEYSDISPLRGGNVLFSTLVGRPSAYSFDSSPELQDWVTATDLLISLNRLHTFGDEYYEDVQVLRTYWYAIADVAVGARCKCNGHASRCEVEEDENGRSNRVCRCEHRTAGRDCERCEDFYNDAPWGRSSQSNVHECKPCNCNGYSNRCYFDKELYETTGHGGHCIDCTENRSGPNCEQCKENYYQREDGVCIPCNCDATGSRFLQCNSEGKCQCKPGVSGDKCDSCSANHYDFTMQGCKPCGCVEQGSYQNTPVCDPVSGFCVCKENVEGKMCGQCKPGFFNLDYNNEFGCTPCFCYGHSSECDSAPGYTQVTQESQFVRSNERWTAENDRHEPVHLQYNPQAQNIALTSTGPEMLYFVAPERFLGNQRASYNHELLFNLRIGESNGYPSQNDLILEGAGKYVSINLFAQNNEQPSERAMEYSFRLHESPIYRWTPTLSTIDYMSILSNLTAIKIRGTYNHNGVGYLDNFRLQTAQRGVAGAAAQWVEQCRCPEGYVGQFCESCAPGYRYSPANGGPFMMCIPCDCNHHTNICESETGLCICEHNTAGDNCELCAKGYYGNAITGTPHDCTPCPCPDNSACLQMQDQSVVCIECPRGYAGSKCEFCSDGYFGDPTGQYGEMTPCEPCNCNGNVDPNAVGNCNRTTGECLKCIYNTAGETCDHCLNGYYGDALAPEKGECRPCECFQPGTVETQLGPPECNQLTGYCSCRPHVTGRNCDKCEPGYFNINSGEGCTPCDCNSDGSLNNTCDPLSGQCYCKEGVDGKHCDQCKAYHYGFSAEGCKYCDCDEGGSTNYQCDPSGQCSCQENVEGRRCDRCMENKQRRGDRSGCQDCPVCYNLVQDSVNQYRMDLEQLNLMLSNISKEPTVVENADFDSELSRVKAELADLSAEAEGSAGAVGGGKPLTERVAELGDRLGRVRALLTNIHENSEAAEKSTESADVYVKQAQLSSEAARKELSAAADYLDGEGLAALSRAQNRSGQFGQQSTLMSEIAQQSRLYADKLEKDAKKIKEVAETAYNTSLAANKLAKDGLNKQNNISAELQILTSEMSAGNGTLKNVQEVATQALSRSKEVYDKALDAYVNVNSTQMPSIDTEKLQNNISELVKKSNELQAMIDELSSNYEVILGDLDQQLKRGRELHDQGADSVSDITEILDNLLVVKMGAADVVNQTIGYLQDANKMHGTLKNFSNKMTDSRIQAEKESLMIPNIQIKLDSVNEQRAKLQEELDKATGAVEALLKELDVEEGDKISKAAAELRKKASVTRYEAMKLRDEADKLSGRVLETGRRIDALNATAQENAQYTNDAKIKVAQAKTDAVEAEKLVERAKKDLEDIMDELRNVQSLNNTELDILQKNLDRAEMELSKADLAGKIVKLHAAKKAHIGWINECQVEAASLEAQVANVKEIKDALPMGCFRKPNLEPI